MSDKKHYLHLYRELGRGKKRTIFILFLLLLAIMLIALSFGSIAVTPGEIVIIIMKRLFQLDIETVRLHEVTIMELRLPRIIMGMLLGTMFGIAGCGIQTILNNPMASPYTLGISSSAGFGAALVIAFGFVGDFSFEYSTWVAASAFAFSFLTCFFIYCIGKMERASSVMMLLSGIALMYLFSGFLALIQYFASEQVLQEIVFWLFGSLDKATWPKTGMVFAISVLVCPVIFANSWKLTALRLGDEAAEALGIDTKRMRLSMLIYTSVLTAGAVCFTGVIGFIGLVAPHLARILVGEDQRFMIPCACLTGAILLVVADTIGRTIVAPYILPVGIVTSFIGAPFFLYLILAKGKIYWQ